MTTDVPQTVQSVETDEEPILLTKRMPEDADMDITPMIDIVFLLLIFFIVSSRLDEDTSVRLPTARLGTSVAATESVVLTVADSGGERAWIYTADGKQPDTQLPEGDLQGQEEAIAEYVNLGLRGELPGGGPPKKYVLIKAERTVKHREVARVASAVGAAEEDVTLFVAVLEE